MARMTTAISWTTSTWNPTTGCTKVSAGCEHCYAEALVNRLMGGNFDQVRMLPHRLAEVRQFKPMLEQGRRRPRLVFVNSMSDLMHADVTDDFRARVFDAMESMPETIFQVLTKRPMTLRRFVGERYGRAGMPQHIWLGVSVEDNRVRQRIDILREVKAAVRGGFTAFLSVEPLIGLPDRHDYRSIDWVLLGGESGGGARDCPVEFMRCGRDRARADGAALWFKQWGKWSNNPLYARANGPSHLDRVRQAIAAGERKAWIVMDKGKPRIVGEKGGATLDGEVLHEYPPHYHALERQLNASLI